MTRSADNSYRGSNIGAGSGNISGSVSHYIQKWFDEGMTDGKRYLLELFRWIDENRDIAKKKWPQYKVHKVAATTNDPILNAVSFQMEAFAKTLEKMQKQMTAIANKQDYIHRDVGDIADNIRPDPWDETPATTHAPDAKVMD